MELDRKPEQFLELIRILRERGYTDKYIKPGIELIISRNKRYKILFDILALPSAITGAPPLLEALPGSSAEALLQLEEGTINQLVTISRESEFMELVDEIKRSRLSQHSVKTDRVHIPENHPILFSLSDKLTSYLEVEPDDEYGI